MLRFEKQGIIFMNNAVKPEDVYQLSEEEAEAVQEGIDQIENGFWISNEEANKRIDALLRKAIE
jgi:predicted transcriptional regulator